MRLLCFVLMMLTSGNGFSGEYVPCSQDPERLEHRQATLQALASEDQKDRSQHPISSEDWDGIKQRDLSRRKQVGEIFGEGCFKDAADFAAGALIFQHGDSPEHYWQAFVWSMRAIQLGDDSQKSMAANGVDRFLVNTNRKQLFASQAAKPYDEVCWCLRPVEHSFPDAFRVEYKGRSYREALDWVSQMNEQSGHSECPAVECSEELEPTPQGFVPGLW